MISTKFRSRTETPRPISTAISQNNELSMNELTKSNDRTSQTMRAIYKDLRTEGAMGIRPYTTPLIKRLGGQIEGGYLDETIGSLAWFAFAAAVRLLRDWEFGIDGDLVGPI